MHIILFLYPQYTDVLIYTLKQWCCKVVLANPEGQGLFVTCAGKTGMLHIFCIYLFFPKDKVTSNKSVASINYYRTQKQQISRVGTVRLNRNKEERISSPFHCRGSHLLVTLKNRPDKNI